MTCGEYKMWPGAIYVGEMIFDMFSVIDGIYYARIAADYCVIIDFVTGGLYYVSLDQRLDHELECHTHVDFPMADCHVAIDYMIGTLDGVNVRNYVFANESVAIFVSFDQNWITLRPRTYGCF